MNNGKTVSAHQTGIIAGILLFTLKLTTLPSLLYEYNGSGGILSIIFVMALNFLFLLLLVWVKKKFPNEDFYAILCKRLGVIVTKIIYFAFFAFFFFKILLIISDSFTFIKDVVDEEFSLFNLFICLLPIITAMAYSGIRTMARTCEFFFPVIIICFVLAIAFAVVPEVNFGMGALTREGFSGFFSSLFRLSFWTGDLFALLIFMDKIEIKKGKLKQIFIPFIISVVVLVVVSAMYYLLYQETSLFHTNLISDVVQYAIGTASGWHMDIFAIVVFLFNIYLQGSIFMYCANECFKKVFNFKNTVISYGFINLMLLAAEFLYLNDYLKYVAFAENTLCYFATAILILVPLMLAIFTWLKKEKKHETG